MVPGHAASSDFELRHYIHVLRRRKWTVFAAVVLVVTVVLVVSFLQTPQYQATAEVVFQPNTAAPLFGTGNSPSIDPARDIQTQIEVIRSPPVRDQVAKALHTAVAPKVSAQAVGGTNAIRIVATSPVPRQAADAVNAYATAYTTFSRSQALNYLTTIGNQLQSQITTLQQQIDGLDQQVANAPIALRPTVQANLSQQRQSLLSQQTNLKQTLSQAQAQSAIPNGTAQLVTPAKLPSSPSTPKPLRDGALGLVVGLLFGVALALLREYLDDSVSSKEDLERSSHGLAMVGMVPAVASWKPTDAPVVISVSMPTSPAAEAYRTLRASLQFLSTEQSLQVIQITSPSAGEGKTTTVANLGVALAAAGLRVCLCCCDLRRPRLHEFFGVSSDIGLTSVLRGDVPLSKAVRRADGVDRLWILPAGPTADNPAEMLSSGRATDLIKAVRLQFDTILIDSPPVLPVADALVLSRLVDATFVVATVDQTTRRGLSRTVELLRGVEAPLIGTILNGVTGDAGYGYGEGYYAYYETINRGIRLPGRPKETVGDGPSAPR